MHIQYQEKTGTDLEGQAEPPHADVDIERSANWGATGKDRGRYKNPKVQSERVIYLPLLTD